MARKSVIRGCCCQRCFCGMHTAHGGFQVQQVIRRVRHKTKALLQKGDYDKAPDVRESTGYLD